LPAAACLLDHTVASMLLTADQQLIEAAKLYFISEVCILSVLRDVKNIFPFRCFFCFKTFFVVFCFFVANSTVVLSIFTARFDC